MLLISIQKANCFKKKIEYLILEAEELREEHPGCGVEKMYYTLCTSLI